MDNVKKVTWAIVLLMLSSCVFLISCGGEDAIGETDSFIDRIVKSGFYSYIKAQPGKSSIVLSVIVWLAVIVVIHIPIKKVKVVAGGKTRLNFIQLVHRFLRISEKGAKWFNRISFVAALPVIIVLIRLTIEILPPPPQPPPNHVEPTDNAVEMQSLEFAPRVDKERYKGNVLFSSRPRITVTCTSDGDLDDTDCAIFFCYTPERMAGKLVGENGDRDEVKGWECEGPTTIQRTGANEEREFSMTFTPKMSNRSFTADLKTTEVSKSNFFVRVENNVAKNNYKAARTKAWQCYRSALTKHKGREDAVFKPVSNEVTQFFFPVFEIPLSEKPEEIWVKRGGAWEFEAERKTLVLSSNRDDSMQVRFKNDGNVILYPFGVRFKINIPKDKRPSALGLCLGNRSPTFIQIKLQSVAGAGDKYKVVILENGQDVTEECLVSTGITRNEWPINWADLDIRLYAYSGKEVLLAISDGENYNYFRYYPKSPTFNQGKGSRFAFRFEDVDAEVELTNVYVFHFDTELMHDYESE